MWGISDVSATYAAAFTLGMHLDRGRPRRAAGAARPTPGSCRGSARAAGCCGEAAARLLLEQGRPAEALAELDRRRRPPRDRQPGVGAVAEPEARALAALGRTDEALAARRRGGGAAAAVGCAVGARAVPAAAAVSCAAPRGRRTSARPCERAGGDPRGPRAGPRPARARARPGGRGREAVPLLRAALAHGPRLRRPGGGRATRLTALAGKREPRRPSPATYPLGSPAASGG